MIITLLLKGNNCYH